MTTTTSITYPAFALFALACFALLPGAHAVCQDGCDSAAFNTFQGDDALTNNITGIANTAVGWSALYSNTVASYNTAVGAGALALNNSVYGDSNTAVGALALLFNTRGNDNTAIGANALLFNDSGNTAGAWNTATGSSALQHNTDGDNNTAAGYLALAENTTGLWNTATGSQALRNSTTSNSNTATGFTALFGNTGGSNTATGAFALTANETGSQNTAMGADALDRNVSGDYNTAIGWEAGSASLGTGNIYIGAGTDGAFFDSGVIRIGDSEKVYSGYGITFIQGIFGATIDMDGVAVYVDSDGQLGTMVSSRRFKKEIKPMDNASEAILALKPVTFHYKSDHTNRPQFGLVAEEVAEVNPDLVVRDKKGEIYTVRYEQINAMLLNEFLKEHRKVEELQAAIAQLKKDFGVTVAQLTARFDEQASQIEKVCAQLEASKPAPQVVNNP